jgi:ribosome-binding factor A
MNPHDAPRRADARSLCADLHPDDGPPARRRKESRPAPGQDRKTIQLCAQVRRTLLALIPSHRSPLLADLAVEAVEPDPDATRLRVVVSIPPSSTHPPAAIHAQLAALSGHFRAELAAAITRKRVPTLTFDLIPRKEAP